MGGTKMLAEVFSEWGIILIVAVVVVIFGSTQLPKLARSLGSLRSEFKKGRAEGDQDAGSQAADVEEKASGS
ncbi:MAG TPA: twin-arginine translocase TatA/TatE family subunit [Acidimicrobiales bacterium]|nr:twin-arginine translocase TatA/TatE family subunit [Acidimicrobiales bacterium]